MQAAQARYGSLKPTQVLALEKHRALVLLQAAGRRLLLCELTVEEDYPHRITAFSQQVLALNGCC